MTTLRKINDLDFSFIREVYNYFILNSTATFHTQPVSISELKDAILINHEKYKSFIIVFNGVECGFCYLSQYKVRQAYDRTAEITIYIDKKYRRNGIGKDVLLRMEEEAKTVGIKVLIGIIAGENKHSINLFSKCEYEKCAHYKQIGEKFGRTLDVVAFQKLI